jgi:hypothetical protein
MAQRKGAQAPFAPLRAATVHRENVDQVGEPELVFDAADIDEKLAAADV